MSFHVPEKSRLMKPHPMGSTDADGNNGVFILSVRYPKNIRKHKGEVARQLICMTSDGLGWEHVSVHAFIPSIEKTYTPTRDEMCLIKQLFWDSEDVVVQFHPRESDYVDNHPNVLHLWRKAGYEFPTPPPILVGVR